MVGLARVADRGSLQRIHTLFHSLGDATHRPDTRGMVEDKLSGMGRPIRAIGLERDEKRFSQRLRCDVDRSEFGWLFRRFHVPHGEPTDDEWGDRREHTHTRGDEVGDDAIDDRCDGS